jgi:hypothetical protein
MPLHPTKYAEMLSSKMREAKVNVWMVNTGWSGGAYGTGKRMSLKYTRALITAALNGELSKVSYDTHETFGIDFPTHCPEVPTEILNPKNTWTDKEAYDQKATYLADLNILKPQTIIRERDLQLYTRVNLSFEGQPLRDIIPVLNTKFNVHIKVMNEKLNHFIFNADFAGFNLPDVLEALKKSINVNYEIKDDNTIELN